jgi:hypothetical protein
LYEVIRCRNVGRCEDETNKRGERNNSSGSEADYLPPGRNPTPKSGPISSRVIDPTTTLRLIPFVFASIRRSPAGWFPTAAAA